MMIIFLCVLLALNVQAKPSLPHFDYAALPDHFDFAPPHFHAPQVFAAPAPAPLLPAPAPVLPAPEPAFAVAAPVPYPVSFHQHFAAPVAPVAPVVAAPVLPPAPLAPVPFALPSYRAIPGPKTTTHHVSLGYAFPAGAPLIAKTHHHHHSIF